MSWWQKRAVAILWVGFLGVSFAAEAKQKSQKQKDKTLCTSREIQRMDCQLNIGRLRVGIYHDKFRVDDGNWIAAHDVPGYVEGVEWKAIQLKKIGNRNFVEFQIWSVPKGETRISELMWSVVEVQGRVATPHLNELIQRRRQVTPKELVQGTPSAKEIRKYHHDPMEKFGLQPRSGKIEWRAGAHKGVL